MDNCQFKVILQANDVETQHYLSELIGTDIVLRKGCSEHQDVACDVDGYSTQESEAREYRVFPHEFATLKDALILSPYGFFRAVKASYDFKLSKRQPIVCVPQAICIAPTAIRVAENDPNSIVLKATARPIYENVEQPILYQDGEIRMLTTEERIIRAKERAAELAQKDRQAYRQEREALKKSDQRRNYIVGELVTRYFPEIKALTPGTDEENAIIFKSLEAFLYVLANSNDTLRDLKEIADQTASQVPEENWRIPTRGANV